MKNINEELCFTVQNPFYHIHDQNKTITMSNLVWEHVIDINEILIPDKTIINRIKLVNYEKH
jgi:hypothetical protein